MNKNFIIGIIIAAVVVVTVGTVALRPMNPNSSYVNLMVNGNGYRNAQNFHYEGTITNSGTKTASNVRINVTFYGANNMLIGNETAYVGDIPASTTKNFSIGVPIPTQTVYSVAVEPLYDH